VRLLAALAGLLTAASAGFYVLYHAKRPAVAAPFFEGFDMAGGLL
jgi:hypothetical protein